MLRFDDETCLSRDEAGGKGATLADLTQAGFPVPAGFCVTTSAYAAFIRRGALGQRLRIIIDALATSDPDALETQTVAIRELIRAAPMPDAVAAAVDDAYERLAPGGPVAVRSSGTAEDLIDESFAGLHDTLLDVLGRDAVRDAIRDCWASLWTARAVAYRNDNGFDHTDVAIAVVVQRMIDSECSGVLFTGHPITTATEQSVVDASWGLGEAIVGGLVVPDQYTLDSSTGRVLDRALGSKKVEVVRNPDTGRGTAIRDVGPERRNRYVLNDSQLRELTALGQQVQEYYEGFPQDLEWARADGRLWLLQSRRITGVEFSWDAEVNDDPEFSVPDGTVWTRGFADEVYNGVITPLNFTLRWTSANRRVRWGARVAGLEDLVGNSSFSYRKACVYANADFEKRWIELTSLPFLRPYLLDLIPEAWRHDVADWQPLSRRAFLLMIARIAVRSPRNLRLAKTLEHWNRPAQRARFASLSVEKIAELSDAALIGYVEERQQVGFEFTRDGAFQFQLFFRQASAFLSWIFDHWITGVDRSLQTALLSGAESRTETVVENLRLWRLSTRVRESEELRNLLGHHENAAFFKAVAMSDHAEVRAFAAEYAEFLRDYGHRGHADRDLIHPRRAEDPSIDYRFLCMFVGVESPVDPETAEEQTNRRREQAYRLVLANLRRGGPRGWARGAVFARLYRYLQKFIVYRDNGRFRPTDETALAQKYGVLEVGRRLAARGLLDNAADVYYLTWPDACALLRGRMARSALGDAKVAARKVDVARLMRKEVTPPMYLQHGRVIDLDTATDHGEDGVFVGTPTSKGMVTGTARVVRFLSDIGTVKAGEILITNSTDPGWTPAFLLLSGIVVETGGTLSHASCLAREYGFPAVQLARATELVPDGARITVNGDTGVITLDPGTTAGPPEPETLVDGSDVEPTAPMSVVRWVELDGCENFRDLGGHISSSGERVRYDLLFRSDTLESLSDDDHRRLDELGIATVIDLRAASEIEQRGRLDIERHKLRYVHLPLIDAIGDPKAWDPVDAARPEYPIEGYRQMLREGSVRLAEVLCLLAEPGALPAVFHCISGKDRTGLVAAVVLSLLDVPRGVVADEYALSQGRNGHSSAPKELHRRFPLVFGAPPANMLGVLDALARDFGSAAGFVASLGVTDEVVERLRVALLDSSGERPETST
ncbi:pyruvate,water dikinase [Kribbella aluminosa]|uniref:Pyruvate,water dikinase n=1 Tax=Kribbella aluminosa TaxID=416017 RepID=A0ABS4UIE6_9ACTN|nr:PEP/pyruvate-binding domain-containing protein [Kribbella aluminosa]MBP2351423.1 pyruvate,water dikinase [Kribbella aluminosa]